MPVASDAGAAAPMPRSIMVLMSVPSATVAFGDRAEQAMAEHVAEFEVLGPWSLETSRRFWEGFTPAALAGQPAGPGLRTVFCAEGGLEARRSRGHPGRGHRAADGQR